MLKFSASPYLVEGTCLKGLGYCGCAEKQNGTRELLKQGRIHFGVPPNFIKRVENVTGVLKCTTF